MPPRAKDTTAFYPLTLGCKNPCTLPFSLLHTCVSCCSFLMIYLTLRGGQGRRRGRPLGRSALLEGPPPQSPPQKAPPGTPARPEDRSSVLPLLEVPPPAQKRGPLGLEERHRRLPRLAKDRSALRGGLRPGHRSPPLWLLPLVPV